MCSASFTLLWYSASRPAYTTGSTPKGSGVSRSAVSDWKRWKPHADSPATPSSMPIIRATTTAAEATPCWAAGTARSTAEETGAITRPSPRPATIRSASIRYPAEARSRGHWPMRTYPVAATASPITVTARSP